MKKYITTIIKYFFSTILIILTYISTGGMRILAAEMLELLFIFFFFNALVREKSAMIQVASAIVMLLFNIELVVLYFSRQFINMIMLTNIPSIQGLAGKLPLYLTSVVMVLAASCLPITKIPLKRFPESTGMIVCLILELAFTLVFGNMYSVAYGWCRLGMEYREYAALKKSIKANNEEDMTSGFYQWSIRNYRDKPGDLAGKPNIVLIMVEGCSQSIIDDKRDIMPRVRKLQKKSLTFTNYYNHTFATYRGIIGQLYSGYQLANLDSNTLVSMQGILKEKGYHTSFINTEPNNLDFSSYLGSMGFDEIISDPDRSSGASNTASDAEAFDMLYENIEMAGKEKKPFFTVMYTYGTHVTLDSPDEKYKDGRIPLLNKFYNLDHQFGRFLDRFNASDLADNTILVFTTDHGAYAEQEYTDAFPKENRSDIFYSRVPLSIYYKGIRPEKIDAGGRNSLDMAPTVLDYLDISGPNYFLGTSLFSLTQNDNSFDHISYHGSELVSTKNDKVGPAGAEEQKIVLPLINKYFIAKTQEPKGKKR